MGIDLVNSSVGCIPENPCSNERHISAGGRFRCKPTLPCAPYLRGGDYTRDRPSPCRSTRTFNAKVTWPVPADSFAGAQSGERGRQ